METFLSGQDYQTYIRLVAEGCREADTQVLAWCLMPNHVHLILVPSTTDGLRAALGEAHRRYTRHVNLREGWRGYLWQGRFHSFPMDETHLLACARYVELNPVRSGLVARPEDWSWSSARAHLAGTDDELVTVAPLLGRIPDWADVLAAGTADSELKLLRQHSNTGRPCGGPAFLETLERTTGRDLQKRKPGRRTQAG